MTEVPPGYQRLNYAELQPDPETQGEVFPPAIEQRDGDRVFIKGYVFPAKQTSGIKQFVLCRDNGDCCFGGQPKLTDRVLVTLKGPLSLNFSTRLQRVAGTFRVEPGQGTDGISGVIYHLDADYLSDACRSTIWFAILAVFACLVATGCEESRGGPPRT